MTLSKSFDYEQFVIAWQGADSVQEVADLCGISKASAGGRARLLRKKHDVPLKKMGRGRGNIDAAALRAIVAGPTEATEEGSE